MPETTKSNPRQRSEERVRLRVMEEQFQIVIAVPNTKSNV